MRKPLFDKCTVLSKVDVELFTVREKSYVLGKSMEDLQMRTRTGTTIIAVERNDNMHTSPEPEFSFEVGDIVFLTGKREAINKSLLYLTDGQM